MGLSDFILIIDRLGILGVVLVILFVSVMFMGSVVDCYQFWHRVRRHRIRRRRAYRDKVKAEILMELHEERKK